MYIIIYAALIAGESVFGMSDGVYATKQNCLDAIGDLMRTRREVLMAECELSTYVHKDVEIKPAPVRNR